LLLAALLERLGARYRGNDWGWQAAERVVGADGEQRCSPAAEAERKAQV